MPKRKLPKSLLPPDQEEQALEAIREALRHPKILSPQEEREFLERRKSANIERHEYVAKLRRGKLVFREYANADADLEKAGADLEKPPYYVDMLKRLREFETETAKVERALRLKAGNQEGRPRPDARSRETLVRATFEELTHLPSRNRASVISKRTGLPVRTIREIIQRLGLRAKK